MELKSIEELLKHLSMEEIEEARGLFVAYGMGAQTVNMKSEYSDIAQAFIESVNYFAYLLRKQ